MRPQQPAQEQQISTSLHRAFGTFIPSFRRKSNPVPWPDHNRPPILRISDVVFWQTDRRRKPTSCHTIFFCGMIIIMSQSIERHLRSLRSRLRHFESGRPLFYRGDTVTDMYFVLTGSVLLVRHQSDGSALILQRACPGSILAEASLYSATYHCEAVASAATDIRVYAKAGFKRMLANSPEFSNVWASYLAQELQRSRLRSEILSLKTVAARLDAWIAWNGGNAPEKGEWKLLASEIGVSPEALYREIAKRRE